MHASRLRSLVRSEDRDYSGLTNTELFTRLFQQRHEHKRGFAKSLKPVHWFIPSFHGEALTGENAELPVLGGLIGKSAQEVFTRCCRIEAARSSATASRMVWQFCRNAIAKPACGYGASEHSLCRY